MTAANMAALAGVSWAGLFLIPPAQGAPPAPVPSAIVRDKEASFAEILAAKEIRRYIYLRTGTLLPLQSDEPGADGGWIMVGSKARKGIEPFLAEAGLRRLVEGLGPQEYVLRTVRQEGGATLLVIGGDGIGTLYGGYRVAEHLGVRFYLHGDVVPDQTIPLAMPDLDEAGKPLFNLRGIQPFHDFPEGPDWWSLEAYKAILGQLPKLGLNFFGLHTYPEGGAGPEPTVWIGLPEEISAGAGVRASYPSRHFTTLNHPSPGTGPAWGYQPTKTSDYVFGADALFDRDDYGADYMRGRHPWTGISPEQCNDLFAAMGTLLHDAFSFARRLGIRTCLGTETPLVIPKQVRERLKAAGRDPNDPAVVQELYEGVFRRIKQAHPLDYYWLWTPEGWTWQAVGEEQIKATLADFDLLRKAAQAVHAPFTLATCGWVLGPTQDPALFDRVLPKDWPMSCINRNVGFDPVEPGFTNIQGRPLWAIPWLEDDPAMIIPQLWVGRMRKDAVDALRYGCTGLMGIHWRTRILGPNAAALAKAAWDQQTWKTPQTDAPVPTPPGNPEERRLAFQKERHAPCADFYADWALAHFGPEAAAEIAALFTRLDGRLPRPSTWVDGPGGIVPDLRPWKEVAKEYLFVEELAALRPKIQGPGHLERFDYWLDNFRYLQAVGELNYTWALLNEALAIVESTKDPEDQSSLAKELGLPMRKQLVAQLNAVHQHLLATVTTPGELGTVANWQQHIMPTLLRPSEVELTKALRIPSLPAEALPSTEYPGKPRLFVPVTRTGLIAGEPLKLEALLPGIGPSEVTLHTRPIGMKLFQSFPMQHAGRGVYRATLTGKVVSRDFEYYLTANHAGLDLKFPPTAPALCQTVIVIVPGP